MDPRLARIIDLATAAVQHARHAYLVLVTGFEGDAQEAERYALQLAVLLFCSGWDCGLPPCPTRQKGGGANVANSETGQGGSALQILIRLGLPGVSA
jgi:hypothetical protein